MTWNEPTSSTQATVTGYNIYQNDISVGDWVLAYSGLGYPTRLVWVAEGLIEGNKYRYKISAHNEVGESSNSTEVLLIASDYPDAPGQP